MAIMSIMLPYELIGMIIDHFEGDTTELAKCTLIARSWLPPSRYHLFRTIVVQQTREQDRLAAFRRFLESDRGQMSASSTQILCLRGKPPDDEEFWEPTLDLHELGTVVHQLPRLSIVDFDYVRLAGLPTDGPAPLTSLSVELINIARITTWPFHDLKDCMDAVHLFPGLKHFRTDDRGRRLQETGRVYTKPPPTNHRPFPPQLKLENLSHRMFGPSSPLLNYILQACNISNLTSLTLWHVLPEEVPSVSRFLVAVKQSLNFFFLSLADCFIEEAEGLVEPQEVWRTFGITQCMKLETFRIYVPWDFDPDRAGPPIDYHPQWLSAELILAQLPPCVRHMEFALELGAPSDMPWYKEVLRDVMWEDVSSSLLRLSDLKGVKFFNRYRSSDQLGTMEPWMEKFLRRKLPEINSRDLLAFELPGRLE